MRSYTFAALMVASSLLMIAHGGSAAETTSYTYDGLGRLKTSAIAGGPNDTRRTNTCFDAAGNRTQYAVANGAPPACGVMTSPDPVAKNPSLLVANASTTAISLSTLASASGPAAIASFTPGSGAGSAAISADRQAVTYTAPALPAPGLCEPAYVNAYSVPYSVQNSPNGPSVAGTATISVRSPAGPRPKPPQACP